VDFLGFVFTPAGVVAALAGAWIAGSVIGSGAVLLALMVRDRR